jgi:hypothetical protein
MHSVELINRVRGNAAVFRWLLRFLQRYLLFSVTVLAGAQAYSWLFGLDDQMRAWASANRPLIGLVVVLSMVIYAMYVWLDENTPR